MSDTEDSDTIRDTKKFFDYLSCAFAKKMVLIEFLRRLMKMP